MAAARAQWKADQSSFDPSKLVFIDETGTATNMARRGGRCRRGERLIGRVPWAHLGKHLGLFTDNLNLGGEITIAHEQALEQLK